jgi:hypothetical protein
MKKKTIRKSLLHRGKRLKEKKRERERGEEVEGRGGARGGAK